MKLRKCGFFDDLPREDAVAVLRRLESPHPSPVERKAVDYLRGGMELLAIPGLAVDVLSDRREIIGPPHVFTDGEWAWTADLPYYLERYHIKLPTEFLERMEAHGWKCPSVDKSLTFELEGWGRIGH